MIDITPETPADGPAIESLLDAAFGADRHMKRSYSYRDGVERLWRLCMVAKEGPVLLGTIRYWPVQIGNAGAAGGHPALLLGPIAVAANYRAVGLGAALMRLSIGLAAAAGHRLIVLVGDEPYYRRFGFAPASNAGIVIENEDPARVLARWLGGQPAGFSGGTMEKAVPGLYAAA